MSEPFALYIVPSRGRPGNVSRLIDAWESTVVGPAPNSIMDLMIVNDIDDPFLDGYGKALSEHPWVKWEVGPRLRLGPTLDKYARKQCRHYRGIGFMGDDHVPKTNAWDSILNDYLAGTPSIVYGNDLLQGQALPTAVLMSSRIIEVLGYMVPPGFIHMYIDNVWKLWGHELGRHGLRYVSHVIIEHLHPAAGKADFDQTYQETNSSEVDRADHAQYDAYLAGQFQEDRQLLQALGQG